MSAGRSPGQKLAFRTCCVFLAAAIAGPAQAVAFHVLAENKCPTPINLWVAYPSKDRRPPATERRELEHQFAAAMKAKNHVEMSRLLRPSLETRKYDYGVRERAFLGTDNSRVAFRSVDGPDFLYYAASATLEWDAGDRIYPNAALLPAGGKTVNFRVFNPHKGASDSLEQDDDGNLFYRLTITCPDDAKLPELSDTTSHSRCAVFHGDPPRLVNECNDSVVVSLCQIINYKGGWTLRTCPHTDLTSYWRWAVPAGMPDPTDWTSSPVRLKPREARRYPHLESTRVASYFVRFATCPAEVDPWWWFKYRIVGVARSGVTHEYICDVHPDDQIAYTRYYPSMDGGAGYYASEYEDRPHVRAKRYEGVFHLRMANRRDYDLDVAVRYFDPRTLEWVVGRWQTVRPNESPLALNAAGKPLRMVNTHFFYATRGGPINQRRGAWTGKVAGQAAEFYRGIAIEQPPSRNVDGVATAHFSFTTGRRGAKQAAKAARSDNTPTPVISAECDAVIPRPDVVCGAFPAPGRKPEPGCFNTCMRQTLSTCVGNAPNVQRQQYNRQYCHNACTFRMDATSCVLAYAKPK